MKHLQSIKSTFFLVIFLVGITSCSKDNLNSDTQTTHVTVKLASAIGELNKIFIDVEGVQFRVKENRYDSSAWINLNAINSGTYGACNFSENSELLLVDNFEIESTFIYEIRLLLGDNNFIDINGVLMSLDIPDFGNAQPSNLVITELVPNRFYDFIIEIDIDSSVSFNEDENIMVLSPKLYTAIRQIQY